MVDCRSESLFVFSHPNHEVAVLGLLGRLSPRVAVLTDGGGQDRLKETRAGLASLGLLDRAVFLEDAETAYYEALLARDVGFFGGVAARLAERLRGLRASCVLCDAVEFYNPVHDICMPIVRAALGPGAPLYEVPLVYQRPAVDGVDYVMQRLPASRESDAITCELSAAELDAKLRTMHAAYPRFLATLEAAGGDVTAHELGVEVVARAGSRLPRPGAERVLRYEERGCTLRSAGEIDEVITYAGHYLPVASTLWRGAPEPRP